MTIRSLSFDDEDDADLCVFSGYDLLISHHDIADLDWGEVAERAAIDERRGLVITQTAVLEDLIDEFLIYLEDPPDPDAYQHKLDALTIGPRVQLLETKLEEARLLDQEAAQCISDLRAVVARRNQLAHGTIYCRPVQPVPINELGRRDLDLEWVLVDRRSRQHERVSMARLREDLHEAIGVFAALLAYAELFVERAPRPVHFTGGGYLGSPSP